MVTFTTGLEKESFQNGLLTMLNMATAEGVCFSVVIGIWIGYVLGKRDRNKAR